MSPNERGAPVTAQRQPETPYLADLIDDATNGRVVLPEFQRDFKWKPEQVRTLISSIAQGWPIGAFMIWRPSEFQMATRPFAGLSHVATSDSPSYLLDGQQRLTAMIHARQPDFAKDRRYYFNGLVEFLAGDDTDLDEFITDSTVNQFSKRFSDLESRARSDIALISDIMSDQNFDHWVRAYEQHHPQSRDQHLFSLRERRLPGLKAYQVPCIMLNPDDGLEAVARIFVTTNRTGLRLNLVDLMTAKVYAPDFRMRDEWAHSLDQDAALSAGFGNPEHGVGEEAVLRILAYWSTNGTRVTERFVLAMSADFVRREWSRAVNALHNALALLRDECGVIQSSLLPAPRMAVSLAIALDTLAGNKIDSVIRAVVHQWFWRTIVDSAFDRGTNARTISEAKRLIMAFDKRQTIEYSPLDQEVAKTDLVDRLLAPDGGDGALEAGVLCMIIASGGKDWKAEQKPLVSLAGKIERHHIVPQKSPIGKDWEHVNCIANLTPQSTESNKELKNDLPLQARVRGELAADHLCDVAELGGIDEPVLQRFVERRAEALADAIYERASEPK